MNIDRLNQILNETTIQLRKGAEITESSGVVEIFKMPHVSEAQPWVEKIDLHFIVVGVDKERAEQSRSELIELLKTYPQPDRLVGGPSYIEVGAVLGDQGAALQLFALGQVLGLWKVITPATLGFKEGPTSDQMAGGGFIMISGFKGDPNEKEE
jgi:hypothetical protein